MTQFLTENGAQDGQKGYQNGAESDPKQIAGYVLKAWYLLYRKHMGPSPKQVQPYCFVEQIQTDTPEGSEGTFF